MVKLKFKRGRNRLHVLMWRASKYYDDFCNLPPSILEPESLQIFPNGKYANPQPWGPEVSFNYGFRLKAHDPMICVRSRCRWGCLDSNHQEQLLWVRRPGELRIQTIYLPPFNENTLVRPEQDNQSGHSHSKKGKAESWKYSLAGV